MSVTIYELELQEGKYYVGKTVKPEPNDRILQHFTAGASAWTRRYKPVRVIEKHFNCNDFDEDKYTKMLMKEHGIANVRGGTYVTMVLPKTTIKFLEKEFRGADNQCFQCGGEHFIKYCPERKATDICARCGRGHKTTKCYATTHVKGYRLYKESESDSSSESDLDTQVDVVVYGDPKSDL